MLKREIITVGLLAEDGYSAIRQIQLAILPLLAWLLGSRIVSGRMPTGLLELDRASRERIAVARHSRPYHRGLVPEWRDEDQKPRPQGSRSVDMLERNHEIFGSGRMVYRKEQDGAIGLRTKRAGSGKWLYSHEQTVFNADVRFQYYGRAELTERFSRTFTSLHCL